MIERDKQTGLPRRATALRLRAQHLFRGFAKLSQAPGIINQGLPELILAKIRPVHRSKPVLAVGGLPDKEIAKALFSGGADN